MVGSLMYLIATRLDVMHSVSLIFRFMETPKDSHWQARKRILRYVNRTEGFGILYITNDDFKLVGYTDSYWAGSLDDRKSTYRYMFDIGSSAISFGKMFLNLPIKLQSHHSTCERIISMLLTQFLLYSSYKISSYLSLYYA